MTGAEAPARALPTLGGGASLVLDALRGGAAQAVVVGHAISFLGIWPQLEPPEVPWVQDTAVVVFFVLSGLLITHSVRRRSADPRRRYLPSDYVIDRFSRIYTAYLPALLFVVVVDALGRALAPEVFGGYEQASGPVAFVVNLLMLQDFPLLTWAVTEVGGDAELVAAYGTARPFWTVAVEWWIYLAVGWLLVVRSGAGRGPLRVLVLTCAAALVAVVPAVHLLGGRGDGLFSAWLFGAAVSWLWPALARSSVPRRVLLAAGSILVVVSTGVLFAMTADAYDLRFAGALALGLAVLLAGLPDDDARRPAAWWRRLIVYVASYSFSLYLLHYTVTVVVLSVLTPSIPTFVAILVASNVVAMAFAWATERHHLRVRAHLRSLRDRRRRAASSDIPAEGAVTDRTGGQLPG